MENQQEREDGYGGCFYVALLCGVVGIIGFLVVAAGAAGGM